MSEGFARSMKSLRYERQAEEYEEVASQIETGGLKIRGADPTEVKDRMRDKAARLRAGERVYTAVRTYGFGSGLSDSDDDPLAKPRVSCE